MRRFRIAIRQVDGDENEMSESLKSIKENGFINYYGLQRFGNCAGVPTFDVGIALLKSDYKEVICCNCGCYATLNHFLTWAMSYSGFVGVKVIIHLFRRVN